MDYPARKVWYTVRMSGYWLPKRHLDFYFCFTSKGKGKRLPRSSDSTFIYRGGKTNNDVANRYAEQEHRRETKQQKKSARIERRRFASLGPVTVERERGPLFFSSAYCAQIPERK